ncbi:MAG TPA: hypothetical protein VKR59_04660 [Terriglobales bacterium]|nr:hypothetical protein [Terriglobales bacterium]
MPPAMLRFKNGVSFEDPTYGLAEKMKAAHANDTPRPLDVPAAERWLSQRADEIRDHDRTAQNLKLERDQTSRKLDTVREGSKLKYGTRTALEVAAEKGQRLVQHYEDELKELDRRITRSENLAAQVRRAVAEFHESTPQWPAMLREYNSGALGERGVTDTR